MTNFGVEIEFLVPNTVTMQAIAVAVQAAGVECVATGYNHATTRHWKVVTDGSLQAGPGRVGFELVSPVLTEADFHQIEKVSAVLLQLGAIVNRTCGLHVHIDARQHSVAALKKLAELYITHEPVIDRLLPTSRRASNNQFCRSVTQANVTALNQATDINAIARAVHNGNRYSKLNYTAFWRHGTVEFRHHSGTVEAAKIIKWIVLCSKMVEVAVREAGQPITLQGGTVAPQASQGLSGYWRSGRRTRMISYMLSRPEGATAEEIRVQLGVRSRPNVRWHFERCTDAYRVMGRRNGHEVFMFHNPGATLGDILHSVTQAQPVAISAPATLDGLCDKLGLSQEDKAFWAARAAMLASRGANREAA